MGVQAWARTVSVEDRFYPRSVQTEVATGDIVWFARELLGFHPDSRQEELLRCDAKQGILNCSRQWGKSTVAAIKAVHRAHAVAKSLVVVACPTERQSAEFVLKARGFVDKLGVRVRGDGHNRASLRLPNGSRIVGLPGKEANIRGLSAVNLLIIDEASRVPDELYKALRPMLTVANGDLWLLSTPWGKQGFFHENWEYGGDLWARFKVPATECLRIPADRLEMERAQLGDAWFRQEYLCEFTATESQMFDTDLVRAAVEEDGQPCALSTIPAHNERRGSISETCEEASASCALRPGCFEGRDTSHAVFIGLDLGQKRDHTAIAVVEREEKRLAWMDSMPQCMRIRYLQRIPLGTPYTKVVEQVGEIVRHPMMGGRCRLVADAPGVGAPVVDLLKAAHLNCSLTPVMITSGERASSQGDQWNVPKRDLLMNLLVMLEAGELRIPRRLGEAGALVRELSAVEMRHRAGGGVRMGADGAGEHDDLVMAVALACWRGKKKENSFGTQRLV